MDICATIRGRLLRRHISNYAYFLWSATDVCRLHSWTNGIWLQDMMHLNHWCVIQYSHNRVWQVCWFLWKFYKCLSQWILVSLNNLSLQKRKNNTFRDGVLEVKPDTVFWGKIEPFLLAGRHLRFALETPQTLASAADVSKISTVTVDGISLPVLLHTKAS